MKTERMKQNQMVVSVIIFLLLLGATFLGIFLTSSSRHFMPYYLTRVLLVSMVLFYFGILLSKAATYFWGEPKKISAVFSRTVKIICISLVLLNIVIVLPYLLWCIKILFHVFSGSSNIEMIFPNIIGYNGILNAFLTVMYKTPYIYILVGFCIGAFTIRERSTSH